MTDAEFIRMRLAEGPGEGEQLASVRAVAGRQDALHSRPGHAMAAVRAILVRLHRAHLSAGAADAHRPAAD
jgi:hypothetical protein